MIFYGVEIPGRNICWERGLRIESGSTEHNLLLPSAKLPMCIHRASGTCVQSLSKPRRSNGHEDVLRALSVLLSLEGCHASLLEQAASMARRTLKVMMGAALVGCVAGHARWKVSDSELDAHDEGTVSEGWARDGWLRRLHEIHLTHPMPSMMPLQCPQPRDLMNATGHREVYVNTANKVCMHVAQLPHPVTLYPFPLRPRDRTRSSVFTNLPPLCARARHRWGPVATSTARSTGAEEQSHLCSPACRHWCGRRA